MFCLTDGSIGTNQLTTASMVLWLACSQRCTFLLVSVIYQYLYITASGKETHT
jgi:hypothetical protein